MGTSGQGISVNFRFEAPHLFQDGIWKSLGVQMNIRNNNPTLDAELFLNFCSCLSLHLRDKLILS